MEDLFCGYNKCSYDILSKLFGVKVANTKRGYPGNQSARKIYHAAKYIMRECEQGNDDDDFFNYGKNGASKEEKEQLAQKLLIFCESNGIDVSNDKAKDPLEIPD